MIVCGGDTALCQITLTACFTFTGLVVLNVVIVGLCRSNAIQVNRSLSELLCFVEVVV